MSDLGRRRRRFPSSSDDSPSGGAHIRGSPFLESFDITHRGLAEEAAVFAIELRGALVADLESRTGRIETLIQHQVPRGLEPKLFLILKGAHGRQHPEMMVER